MVGRGCCARSRGDESAAARKATARCRVPGPLPGSARPRSTCHGRGTLSPPPRQVMLWIAGYQATLGEFGVEEGECAFPTGPHAGLSLLIDKYVQRIKATLASWLVNIVEVGKEGGGWGRSRGKGGGPRALQQGGERGGQCALQQGVEQGRRGARVSSASGRQNFQNCSACSPEDPPPSR